MGSSGSNEPETSRAAVAAAFASQNHEDLVRLREVDSAVARITHDIQLYLEKTHYIDRDEADFLRARRAAYAARGTPGEAAARGLVEDARQTLAARRLEVALLIEDLLTDVKEQANDDLQKGN